MIKTMYLSAVPYGDSGTTKVRRQIRALLSKYEEVACTFILQKPKNKT